MGRINGSNGLRREGLPAGPRSRYARVTTNAADGEVPDAADLDAYHCGGRPMVEEVRALLLGRSADSAHVHREEFY